MSGTGGAAQACPPVAAAESASQGELVVTELPPDVLAHVDVLAAKRGLTRDAAMAILLHAGLADIEEHGWPATRVAR